MMEQIVTVRDSVLIQKSEPLRKMKNIPYTLTQLKLIDLYLSCINIDSEIKQTLKFNKKEYEDFVGLKNCDWNAVYSLAAELSMISVKLPIKENGEEIYKEIVLFNPISYEYEEHNKKSLLMTCSNEAKDYFYCLHKYRYTKYKFSSVHLLSSKYSYLLFVYINAMRQMAHIGKEWIVPIDKLRDDVFNLEGHASYKEFKIFKRDVLNVAVNEINEKTNYQVEYDLYRTGRSVSKILFHCVGKSQFKDEKTD